MTEEREDVSLGTLSRWLLVLALVVVGIGLYFAFGRRAAPVVPSVMVESSQ